MRCFIRSRSGRTSGHMDAKDTIKLCEADEMEKCYPDSSWVSSKGDFVKRNVCRRSVLVGFFTLVTVMLVVGIIVVRVHEFKSAATVNQQVGQLTAYETVINNLTKRLEDIEKSNKNCSNVPTSPSPSDNPQKSAGVTYVRWGRTVCPDTADLVYSGIAAGGKGATDSPGGGANYLCLTKTPKYLHKAAGKQDSRSRIYGAEYRSWPDDRGALADQHGHDVPCAVCQSRGGRTQVLMMPSTTDCPNGWITEYEGFLSASRHNHPRTEYVCTDSEPETLPGTMTDQALSYFFQVEGVCTTGGGLPCLPYEDGAELTCAICTM